jgi:hypothetical protein
MDPYKTAKRSGAEAADALLDVAAGKAAAAKKTPTDSLSEALKRAQAEKWTTTDGSAA